ncbi:MAG: hypothetical protein OHK0013_45890 [Sandaracinaceae bacterium]
MTSRANRSAASLVRSVMQRCSHRSTSAAAAALALAVLAASMPDVAHARAVCRDPRGCGRVDERILPPIPSEPEGPVLRPALRFSQIAGRLRALGPRVDACFAAHFEGERAPRTLRVTVFVHRSGRWSLAFGVRPRTPRADEELRGASPLEVCIADWISGELGPRIEPARGRAVRRVAHVFRITPLAGPPAEGG